MEDDANKTEAFLCELTDLSYRYGLWITGELASPGQVAAPVVHVMEQEDCSKRYALTKDSHLVTVE